MSCVICKMRTAAGGAKKNRSMQYSAQRAMQYYQRCGAVGIVRVYNAMCSMQYRLPFSGKSTRHQIPEDAFHARV
ncbi:unnamed protein product [Victoria cruziana]